MLKLLSQWARQQFSGERPIPDAMWAATLAKHPFLVQTEAKDALELAAQSAGSTASGAPAASGQLRRLTSRLLACKQFSGAHGFVITDDMAVAIAAQAALPLLHMAPPSASYPLAQSRLADTLAQLAWYSDFVGIVVHEGEVLASRTQTDEAGIVHAWREAITGEAMEGGPIMLSWHDVAHAGQTAAQGYNVVIHEFIHAIDMHGGQADGCPILPAGFLNQSTAKLARAQWRSTMSGAFDRFNEQVALAERFGQARPWLDFYAATSIPEFFAVTGEAYFVNRSQFKSEFADLLPMYDAFFKPLAPSP